MTPVSTILSIQSSVAYGHVGNSAATFPLMRLGHEVMPVLTVHFAASTLYGEPHGPLLTPSQVGEVIGGLDSLGFLAGVDAVLSGYQGAPAMGAEILDAVARTKAASPDALYLCDPVLGDVGRGFYVLPGVPEFMRDEVVPRADIMTPNQFELEFLTGRACRTVADVLAAATHLLDRGPRIVVVTSVVAPDLDADQIHMLAVGADGAWLVSTPRIDQTFDGSGDVTAAVFLAHYLATRSVSDALGRAASTLYGLLKATFDLGRHELALVAAQDEFVAPSHAFTARPLT